MDSKILSEYEQQIFHQLLRDHQKDIGTYFGLLYRGSPNFLSKVCHKKTLGKSGTITVIETKSNNVFGVYTAHKFAKSDGDGAWHHDENAFCFLIRSSAKHQPNIFEHNYNDNGRDEYTLQTYRDCLCIFGLHGTIVVQDGGKGTAIDNTSFTIPEGSHLNGGKKFGFMTKEYEVWHCLKKAKKRKKRSMSL